MNNNFKMLLFMVQLSIMLEKLDELKGLNVYERKIKMRGDALLKELEDYDKALNASARKRKDEVAVLEANLQYATCRDSYAEWGRVWERFIQLDEPAQFAFDNEIEQLLKKHGIHESNTGK